MLTRWQFLVGAQTEPLGVTANSTFEPVVFNMITESVSQGPEFCSQYQQDSDSWASVWVMSSTPPSCPQTTLDGLLWLTWTSEGLELDLWLKTHIRFGVSLGLWLCVRASSLNNPWAGFSVLFLALYPPCRWPVQNLLVLAHPGCSCF